MLMLFKYLINITVPSLVFYVFLQRFYTWTAEDDEMQCSAWTKC